ncbi:hypothetical protein DOY81_006156 [Sarcophaga bullata]|nr:hypothetical protein DOY81_006156 [Sarcophaga bullata]
MDDLVKTQYQDLGAVVGLRRNAQSDESLTKRIATTTTSTIFTRADEESKTNNGTGDGFPSEEEPPKADLDAEEFCESEFLLEEFCDELLYEIFKFLDTWSLMALMNVSKRFQKFVLDKRLWEDINLSQEPLPLGILEDMLERSHEKTRTIKLRGPSPSQHIEGEIQHFNQTIHISLTTRCTKLVTLELYGITLDINQITFKDFPQTLKRLVLNTCNVRFSSNKSLFTGIDTILVNLEELAIENNSWFDPYYIMPISKLPILRNLSLKGCWQMQEFIPYGSIAARHGFKQLEILDLRDTPLNDSDLQCFNAIETLKEIYLQCPEEDNTKQTPSSSSATTGQSETMNNVNKNSVLNCTTKEDESHSKPSTSSVTVEDLNRSSENIIIASLAPRSPSISDSESNTSILTENPTSSSSLCSTSSSKDDNTTKTKEDSLTTVTTLNFNDIESSSSSSSSSSASSPSSSSSAPSCSQSPKTNANNENNTASPSTSSSSSGFGLSPNILPLVGTNTPPRSRFLPRPDHIFYLDVRDRASPNAVHFNPMRHNFNTIRQARLHGRSQQNQQNQPNQQLPPPVIEQMMHHNLFWDIVNPLGRVVGVGGPDRLFGEENSAEYHLNLFPLSSSNRQQSRGTISDRGVCCFGRTRQPVQHGVIWIRFNNRPSENRFERFSVRDYKFVTDVSLQHLVQCSPHLIFLDVSGTSVTIEGIQRFKELKPECKVVAEHLLGITATV